MPSAYLDALNDHAALVQRLAALDDAVAAAVQACADTLRTGGKILLCGNGGSAADTQHIAAELVGRFVGERRALAAIALTTDSSALTAIANDYGYDHVFARQVAGLGRPGDLLVGISTSGTSPNVLAAMREARTMGLRTVALAGKDGGPLAVEADHAIVVPSTVTARIQEAHILIGHALCAGIERALGLEGGARA